MLTLNPYLVFKDNCEDAFNFYKVVFGADNLYISHYKNVPQDSKQLFPLSAEGKVMHATLQINAQTAIMGCDSIEAYDEQAAGNAGKNFYLHVSIDSRGETDRVFGELSAGGQVVLPMEQTFWGSYFGMIKDKFGITWKLTFNGE